MVEYIIIGGGPVGCAAALQLARLGHSSAIYEGRGIIPTDPEQSYPIGVNPRGLHAIASVAPQVAEYIKTEGRVIDAWEIYAGTRRVAKQESGIVYGTSRGNVNLQLWQAASTSNLITIHMNHRLTKIDFTAKSLEFDVLDESTGVISKVTVDASKSRIIGADGVNSKVREAMQEAYSEFQAKITPWTNEYRVLFARPGEMTDKLNPRVHYIFGGGYTATIDNHGQQQWTVVTCLRESDPISSPSQLVIANEASEENVAQLKEWVKSFAPDFLPLVAEEEFTKFFSRRTYRGAVVECSHLQMHDWIVLLGDSAHSVLPPTGEGINSGLEDTLVLGKSVEENPDAPFPLYEQKRKPDIDALLEYALYLNAGANWGGEKVARGIFMVLEAQTSESIGKQLFGPLGVNRGPYREIIAAWKTKRAFMLNAARVITYPIGFVVSAIMFIPDLFKSKENHLKPRDTSLKSIV